MTQRCDECRELFDPERPGALIVTAHRGVDADEWDDGWFVSGDKVVLRFCSQEHAGTHLATRVLPQAAADEDEPWSLEDVVVVLVLLTLVGCAGYGLSALVRAVGGLLV